MAWPRTIVFSYGGESCINQPLLLPGILTTVGSDTFSLQSSQKIRLGNSELAAGKVCVIPKKAPSPGEHKMSFSPFGIGWLGKTFTIRVAAPPVLSVAPLTRSIPVSKPLQLPISTVDKVFSYKMKVGDATIQCPVVSKQIICDVPKFALSQGTAYKIELIRYFDNKKVATIINQEIRTLTAVAVSATSIKPQETVYAKPKTLRIDFDKPIVSAQAVLVRNDEGKKTEIPLKASVAETRLDVSWDADLPRRVTYELRVDKVLAADGSTLIEPFVMPFTTSGGPKVTGISIGRTKVPVGTTAVLSFDQPLSEKQDISKAVAATNGAVVERRGNQVLVSLAAVPKCGDFTISVNDTLLSNYEIAGGSTWSYGARTLCQTVGSIGTSAKGRAITAYYFGDGPTAAIYTGAIHGSESSTRALMLRWIDDLESNPGGIPVGKSVVVVPAINPDGIASGQRTNANNVDLNRNFGTSDWKKDITTVNNAPFPGGGGSAPMSESETRAIAGLVAQRRPQLVLSYHSIGGVVISNQSGNASARAATYVSMSGYGNATGQSSTTFDYSISGTADDYYAEKLGVPSLVIELGSHTYHQFERNQKAMWAMLQ